MCQESVPSSSPPSLLHTTNSTTPFKTGMPRKRVRFAPVPETSQPFSSGSESNVHYTWSREDLTVQEMQSYWFSKHDYHQFRAEARALVEKLLDTNLARVWEESYAWVQDILDQQQNSICVDTEERSKTHSYSLTTPNDLINRLQQARLLGHGLERFVMSTQTRAERIQMLKSVRTMVVQMAQEGCWDAEAIAKVYGDLCRSEQIWSVLLGDPHNLQTSSNDCDHHGESCEDSYYKMLFHYDLATTTPDTHDNLLENEESDNETILMSQQVMIKNKGRLMIVL